MPSCSVKTFSLSSSEMELNLSYFSLCFLVSERLISSFLSRSSTSESSSTFLLLSFFSCSVSVKLIFLSAFSFLSYAVALATSSGVTSTSSKTPLYSIMCLASNSITCIGLCYQVCPMVVTLITSGNSFANATSMFSISDRSKWLRSFLVSSSEKSMASKSPLYYFIVLRIGIDLLKATTASPSSF